MPIPALELARWMRARVHLEHGEQLLALPEQALPLALQPQVWVLSAAAPLGQPSDEDAQLHRVLTRSLTKNGHRWREVEIELDGHRQAAVLVQDITRRKAVQLGYKRKQWAVLSIDAQGAQVVYTGVNSRAR